MTSASVLRGIDTSMIRSFLSGRVLIASSTWCLWSTAWGAPVATRTRSDSATASVRRAMLTAFPPSSSASSMARLYVLLDTMTVPTFLPTRFLEMTEAMSPAPRMVIALPLRSPILLSASSTAADPTDTAPLLSAVSDLTLLPTIIALSKRRVSIGPTWPFSFAPMYDSLTWCWIWSSPTISESSPQTTLNRCLMLSLSSRMYEMLVEGTIVLRMDCR